MGHESPSRIVCIGLDAAEPSLLRAWAASGRMPVLQGLMQRGSAAVLHPPTGFYVSSAWPSFSTSLSPLRHGRFAGRQLCSGSYRVEELSNTEITATPFWETLSSAGKRVAVLDVPKSVPGDRLNGIQLTDWATHDPGQGVGFHCWPAELRGELLGGLPPDRLGTCEVQRSGRKAFQGLTDALITRIQRKGQLTRRLLAREPWDLLISVFSEAHCIGHQAWHLHDREHPRFDARIVAAIGDPIEQVYRALDAELGTIVAAAGPDVLLVLMSSHGFGPNYSGDHLLRPMLSSVLRGRTSGGGAYGGLSRIWDYLPDTLRAGLKPLQKRVRQALLSREQSRGRCFQLPNNASYSGLRANLQGREPEGVLPDWDAVDALHRQLAHELPRFVNDDTGRSVVEHVWRTEELWPDRERMDNLPDFLVQWRMDAAVEAVTHPELGTLRGRYHGPRSGEHREQGMLLMAGPKAGLAAGTLPAELGMTEVGPMLCGLLGVSLPHAVEEGSGLAAVTERA